MDSRDLRNLSEAWDNITSSEFEVLDEQGGTRGAKAAQARQAAQNQKNAQAAKTALQSGKTLGVAGNFGLQTGTKVKMDSAATREQGRTVVRATDSPSISNPQNKIRLAGQDLYRAKLGGKDVYVAAKKPVPSANQNLSGLTIGPGGFNINGRPVQTSPVKPAAPASTAKPAPTATAKPAPTATAKPAPTATSTAAPAAAAPARRSLAQDLADLRAMRAASQMRQQGKKLNGKIPTGADVQAASQSVSDLNKGSRQYMQQDVDMFDIVKGHLMSEGYADSEESAIAIMANMSEEWRQSILEVVTTTGATAPKAVPSQAFPGRPYMGLNRPYQEPFINPSGERAPVDRSLFKGASKPVKKDTKTA